MSFAQNLKNAMTVRNVTTKDLMRETDISQTMVSHYLNENRTPRWYRAIDIADTLEVSLDWLFDREVDNTQPVENTPYGDLVYELMDISGLTAQQVYTDLHMGPNTMGKVRDSEDVDTRIMIQLADYLDTSLDFLAGRGKQSGISQEEIDEYTNY